MLEGLKYLGKIFNYVKKCLVSIKINKPELIGIFVIFSLGKYFALFYCN